MLESWPPLSIQPHTTFYPTATDREKTKFIFDARTPVFLIKLQDLELESKGLDILVQNHLETYNKAIDEPRWLYIWG